MPGCGALRDGLLGMSEQLGPTEIGVASGNTRPHNRRCHTPACEVRRTMTAPTAQASEQPAPDIDALLNRANLALARSRRVVASWLPQRAPAPADGAQASEGEDDEDEETFKPVPEL